ncbi:MAG: YaeQ family protein, partial [bacterium]
AARLHKASKASPRVAVYTHKDPARLLAQLSGERIHKAEQLELYALDRELIAALVARLDRRNAFDLTITERQLYLTIGGETLEGEVERYSLV